MRTRSASTSGGRKRRMRGWNSRTSGDDRHLRVVLKPGPRQRPRTAASSGSRHNAPGFAGGYLLAGRRRPPPGHDHPGVEEVRERAVEKYGTRPRGPLAHGGAVVDHEAEVVLAILMRGGHSQEGDELVARIDERLV